MTRMHRRRRGRRAREGRAIRSFRLLLGCLCASACTVGPDYIPPDQAMPAEWSSAPSTNASVTVPEPVQIDAWWTTFNDPLLDSLVQRAMVSNLDMEAAAERVRAARASVGIARAASFPSVNASGSYTRSDTGATPAQSQWQAGLDALWELDIFGGTRRSVEAADATLQATVEDRRDVLVTLLGEVATDYFALRGYQQELVIAEENLTVQVRNARLTRDKKRLGTGTELDVAQSDAQVASTKAQIASLQELQQTTIYALSVLLGLPPTALDTELQQTQDIPAPPRVMTVGIPADLLRRRPDIRRAERQLAAATAEIGVATADLYPKLSLIGALGLQGNHLQTLGSSSNGAWSFGPAVSVPVFDAGRIASNIEVQTAAQAQALTAYKKTVLTALQEVETALVGFARDQERRAALAEAVAANQRAFRLASTRYDHGVTDFLVVLDSERSLFVSQDALVQSARAVGTDAVALYKALGGGWEIGEEPATPEPTDAR